MGIDTSKVRFVGFGTVLNAITVTVGALIGLAFSAVIHESYLHIALSGLGLVTLGLGIRLFLQSKSILIVAIAMAVGGLLGKAIGIGAGLEAFAGWAQQTVGGVGHFSEAIVTTSILFCVGPMTLLGCIQDAIERKVELLAIKSTMDGIAVVFFAATLGVGTLVTPLVVLVFQGLLTVLARPLSPMTKHPEMLAESTAAGGAMLMGIGLGLLEVVKLPTADFLPAIFLAPLIVTLFAKFKQPKEVQVFES